MGRRALPLQEVKCIASSIGCSLTSVFHGRLPLVLRMKRENYGFRLFLRCWDHAFPIMKNWYGLLTDDRFSLGSHHPEQCGAVLSVKNDTDTLSVWVRHTPDHPECASEYAANFETLNSLLVSYQVYFQPHTVYIASLLFSTTHDG